MKRISSGVLALAATLLFAVPTESQAFFGFFGGGFGFGFGFGGGYGWHGYPGYWYNPWYRSYYPYWRHRYWRYPYFGYLPFHALPWSYTYPTAPAVTAPETSDAK